MSDDADELSFFSDIGPKPTGQDKAATPVALSPAAQTKPQPTESPPSSIQATPLTDEAAASQADPEAPQHWLKHRERLRDKFIHHPESLNDYELLELILFRVIKRRDTKPPAKALIAKFGSLAEVLGAPVNLLSEVKGIGRESAYELKAISAASKRMALGDIQKRDLIGSWDALITYCRTAMAFEQREQFRVLFLNKKNFLIADEVQQVGTVDHTPAYPREVIQRAVNLGATAIILVHNHPSGDPEPSRADIEMTKTIMRVGEGMNVKVHDHLIIGRDGHASLSAAGYLK